MVNKKTLAAVAGLGILAAIFLGRPKVTAIKREPIPFVVPEPIPVPVSIPFLNIDVAKDFLEQQFGELYTKTTKRVDITKTLPGHAKAYYGSGSDARYASDYKRWLFDNRTFENQDTFNKL